MDELADRIVQFLPTPSARRATLFPAFFHRIADISTHALREEGDPVEPLGPQVQHDFYPRPPRGGRPVYNTTAELNKLFLPTPSARRATGHLAAEAVGGVISTHALREEGDVYMLDLSSEFDISTHALREEGDPDVWPPCLDVSLFLPTPSARRATNGFFEKVRYIYFYPRPPRGGRPVWVRRTGGCRPISTHALREEGDRLGINRLYLARQFLPTPSARRATGRWTAAAGSSSHFYPRPPRGGRRPRPDRGAVPWSISTHALREEGDGVVLLDDAAAADFYPRPPRGGRRCSSARRLPTSSFLPTPSARRATFCHAGLHLMSDKFLPTPSARRATDFRLIFERSRRISTHALREEGDGQAPSLLPADQISTHALREEGDLGDALGQRDDQHFYPRPPRGGRRPPPRSGRSANGISTHALREEGDSVWLRSASGCGYFYPRPPRGGRPGLLGIPVDSGGFLPTPSARRATISSASACCLTRDFYPRPPRGGRLHSGRWRILWSNFYPRPPRGGRLAARIKALAKQKFLPTPSARRATKHHKIIHAPHVISTHALREEGDGGVPASY